MSLLYDAIKSNIDIINKIKYSVNFSKSISFVADKTESFDLFCFSGSNAFKENSNSNSLNNLVYIVKEGQSLPSDPVSLFSEMNIDFYSLVKKSTFNIVDGYTYAIECENQKIFIKISDFYSISPLVMPENGVEYTLTLKIYPNYMNYPTNKNILFYVPKKLFIKVADDVSIIPYGGEIGFYYEWKFEVLDTDISLDGLKFALQNDPYLLLSFPGKFNISLPEDQFKNVPNLEGK